MPGVTATTRAKTRSNARQLLTFAVAISAISVISSVAFGGVGCNCGLPPLACASDEDCPETCINGICARDAEGEGEGEERAQVQEKAKAKERAMSSETQKESHDARDDVAPLRSR